MITGDHRTDRSGPVLRSMSQRTARRQVRPRTGLVGDGERRRGFPL
ncbi:hypothetical protein ATKI12_0552 [Kitasatospora sp. Ki12]